jgi:hypothetical protein
MLTWYRIKACAFASPHTWLIIKLQRTIQLIISEQAFSPYVGLLKLCEYSLCKVPKRLSSSHRSEHDVCGSKATEVAPLHNAHALKRWDDRR